MRENQGTSGTESEQRGAQPTVWRSLAACLVTAGLGPSATADVIWDQTNIPFTHNALSQDFEPAYDPYDTQVLADFTTTDMWMLETAVSVGTINNDTGPSSAVIAEIWDDLPLNGGSPILTSVSGTETILGGGVTLEADFGGQVLAPGDYYFSIYVVRDFIPDGTMLLWQAIGNGTPDWFYNPGGALGFGPQFSMTETGGPGEVNFLLTGTVVPVPGMGLFVLLGAPLRSRRRRG